MAALDRTITCTEVQDVAVIVTENLNFDVTRLADELFEIYFIGCEVLQCFGPRPWQKLGQIRFIMHHSHPAAAAAALGFDDDGKADPLGFLKGSSSERFPAAPGVQGTPSSSLPVAARRFCLPSGE